MKALSPPPHTHRFARAETWARLWLAWLGRMLASAHGFLPPLPRALEREVQSWLDQVAKLLAWMLIMRAIAKLGDHRIRAMRRRLGIPSANIGQGTRLNTPLRVIIGGKLRRKFFHGSIGDRIHFMYRALADMDGFAAHLAARLRNGFTRILPILGAYGPPASRRHSFDHAASMPAGLSPLALDTS